MISKIIEVGKGDAHGDIKSMKKLLKYLMKTKSHTSKKDKDYKLYDERNLYVKGHNVDQVPCGKDGKSLRYDYAYTWEQFDDARKLGYNPKKRIQGFHVVFSASLKDWPKAKNKKELHKQAKEMGDLVDGYLHQHFKKEIDKDLYILCVQRDNKHHLLHCHVAFSSYKIDGKTINRYLMMHENQHHMIYDKSIHAKRRVLYTGMAKGFDNYLEHNFEKVTGRKFSPLTPSNDNTITKPSEAKISKKQSFKHFVRARVMVAVRYSKNLKEFKANMDKLGVTVVEKNRSYKDKDGNRKHRDGFTYRIEHGVYKSGKRQGHTRYINIRDFGKNYYNGSTRGLGALYTPDGITQTINLYLKQQLAKQKQKQEEAKQKATIKAQNKAQEMSKEKISPDVAKNAKSVQKANKAHQQVSKSDDNIKPSSSVNQQVQATMPITDKNASSTAKTASDSKLEEVAKTKSSDIGTPDMEDFKVSRPAVPKDIDIDDNEPKLYKKPIGALKNDYELIQRLNDIQIWKHAREIYRQEHKLPRYKNFFTTLRDKAKQFAKDYKIKFVELKDKFKSAIHIQRRTSAYNHHVSMSKATPTIQKPTKPIVGRNIENVIGKLQERENNRLAKKQNLDSSIINYNLNHVNSDSSNMKLPFYKDKNNNMHNQQDFYNTIKKNVNHNNIKYSSYKFDSDNFEFTGTDSYESDSEEDRLISNVIHPLLDRAQEQTKSTNGKVNGYQVVINEVKNKPTKAQLQAKKAIIPLLVKAYGKETEAEYDDNKPEYSDIINHSADLLIHDTKDYKSVNDLIKHLKADGEWRIKDEQDNMELDYQKQQEAQQAMDKEIKKQLMNNHRQTQALEGQSL